MTEYNRINEDLNVYKMERGCRIILQSTSFFERYKNINIRNMVLNRESIIPRVIINNVLTYVIMYKLHGLGQDRKVKEKPYKLNIKTLQNLGTD